MSGLPEPTAIFRGSTEPNAPLVVLLHGRGSDEKDIIALAEYLPGTFSCVALQGPLVEGPGYTWFENEGAGRPKAESFAANLAWFRAWLDEVLPLGRPVYLVGFSAGAVFAAGAVVNEPTRFAGLGHLFSTMPFDAGVPVINERLKGCPVLVAQGDADTVIPKGLQVRTWNYLFNDSGATVTGIRSAGGHQITMAVIQSLNDWLVDLQQQDQ